MRRRVKGADELATAGRLKETIVEIWSNKHFVEYDHSLFYHSTVLGCCRNSRVLNCRFYCIIPSKKTMHLHLSRAHCDCWSATDLASLSLHLILLSASLRASQNFSPCRSEMLFSQRFFCQPLLLPPCTVPCKIGSADLDTCANHFNLRFFTVVKMSS